MAQLLPNGKQTFLDQNGNPLASGYVTFSIPNTVTPKNTWQDAAQTILNQNPVPLDAAGRAIIFGNGAYRQQVYDVNNNLIWDQLTYSAVSASDLSNTGVPGGAGLIGFDGTTLDQQFLSRVDRVVDSIAALRTLAKTTYTRTHVTGYYTAGDAGGGFYWYDPADTTSADNGGTIIVANDGGRWKLEYKYTLNAKQFGLKGDGDLLGGGTDDTARFNALLSAIPPNGQIEIVFPLGVYNVTSVTFGTNVHDVIFRFDKAVIYGNSTTPQGAIITFAGANNCKFYDMYLQTDGNKTSPVYQANYSSALNTTSNGSTFNSCFLWFYGLEIRYIKAGFVNGAFIGSPAQTNAQASEIWIIGGNFRGVLQPIFCNAISGYVVVTDTCIAAQQFESSSSWWVPGQGFCVRNEALGPYDGNHILLQGCEFQRADTTNGNSIYGSNIVIDGCVWEVSQPAFLTGNVSIKNDIDGFFGPAGIEPFQIAAGSTGTLYLENFQLTRPAGTASFDRTKLINATSSFNYKVVLRKCYFAEWYFDATSAAATFVSGCQCKFEDVTISNSTTTSWYLDDQRTNAINNVDLSSLSISLSGTSTPQAGWILPGTNTGNAYRQLPTDSPYTDTASCFNVVTTNPGFILQTQTATKFPVEGHRTYHAEMAVKDNGSGGGAFISMSVSWYDFGGSLISTSNVGQLNQSFFASAGFSQWQMWRGPAIAPPNAYTAAFIIGFGTASNINFARPQLV